MECTAHLSRPRNMDPVCYGP